MSLGDLKLALGNLSQALREVQDCLDLAEYQPDDLSQAWQALDATERELQETRGYLMVCEIPDAWKLLSPPTADERLVDAAAC